MALRGPACRNARPDPGGALAKIAALLRPGGVLTLDEFAWEQLDEPSARVLATIVSLMADRAALEREMEEIRAQLDWVRDYL